MTPAVRRRLDTELVRRGLATSREAARALVECGAVQVAGTVADKPSRLVSPSEPVVVAVGRRFVSRGGDKLDAALERFGVDVAGRRCLDAGASTGGFTDCLLQRGALSVLAVDVGFGQIDPTLRNDPRVRVLERTNVRTLGVEALEATRSTAPRREAGAGAGFEVVVADLSFISLTTVAPVLAGVLAAPGADLVLLVKPQFEAGRVEASRGRGVIRDPGVRREALRKVASAYLSQGATIMGVMASPVLGPAGNAEFLLRARARTTTAAGFEPAIDAVVDAVVDGTVDAAIDAAVLAAPDAVPTRRGAGSDGSGGE
ncbi:MAG: TlyA family RNA methyltransferase [Acidimicrobiales bacterium]